MYNFWCEVGAIVVLGFIFDPFHERFGALETMAGIEKRTVGAGLEVLAAA